MKVHKNLAAFVITYNRAEALCDTLRKICMQTVCPSYILVVNNGVGIDISTTSLPENVKVRQELMESNIGPAGASDWALRHFNALDYEWVQWIDDDDPPQILELNERLLAHYGKLQDERVGIIAPVGSFFNISKGVAVRVSDDKLRQADYIDVQTVAGNQCMLIHKKVIASGALPVAELFFGFEETSFCLNVLSKGFRIVIPTDLFREYRSRSNRWGLTRSDIRKTEIPAWRNYYSVRNLIYLFSYKHQRPRTVIIIVARVVVRATYFIFSRGFRKGSRELYFTLLAIRDGLLKNMGLTVLPEKKNQTT